MLGISVIPLYLHIIVIVFFLEKLMKEIRELKLDVRIETREKDKHEKLYHYVRDRERETKAKVRFLSFLISYYLSIYLYQNKIDR